MRRVAILVAALLALAAPAVAAAAESVEQFDTPQAASSPGGITAAPDGALWFTERSAPAIGRVDLEGAITEFPITAVNAAPQDIAVGPAGDLWATDAFGGVVHRITLEGDITDVAMPTSSATDGIALGPDGALWVTMRAANRIARVVPDGAVTEFPLPASGRQPDGIVAGPDGALWFTERAGNAIGRITVDGTFSEFPLPTAGASPRGIAAGPDGALWFAEHDAGRVGRIDPSSGAVTDIALGVRARPLDVTAGPDGALWLSDEGTGDLARVTVAGQVSRVALPAGGGAPVGVAPGPDGAVWFTRSPSLVGRVGVLAPPVAGRSVDVTTVTGTVLVRQPGSRRFTTLASGGAAIPVGAELDTTHGTVQLTAAVGTATTASKTGRFSGGRFTVVQPRTPVALLTVRLSGPLARCAKASGRRSARAARKRKPDHRYVWGDAKGAFATSGNTAVATVRGTHWRVTDRCDGSTAVTVRTGVVAVTDKVRHKTILVRAGRTVVVAPRRG